MHANIENFNKYDKFLLEFIKDEYKINYLGTHYKEVREKQVLQEKYDKMWDVIYDKIIDPIKNKIVEHDLVDLNKPVHLHENYLNAVQVLSKECDDKDVEVILKAKKQYIEFINEINTDIIGLDYRLFVYLNKVMLVIAKDFKEEGDIPIKDFPNISSNIFFDDNCTYEDEEVGDDDCDYDYISEKINNAIYSDEYKSSEIKNIYARIELFTCVSIIHFKTDGFFRSDFNADVTNSRHFKLQNKLIEDINILYLEGKIVTLKQMRCLLLSKLKELKRLYDLEDRLLKNNEEIEKTESLINTINEFGKKFRVKKKYINRIVYDIDKLLAETAESETQLTAIQVSEAEDGVSKPNTEQNKNPRIYHAKHHVVAFMIECNAIEKDFAQYDGKKKEIEKIGEERMGKRRGNTFYKAFNKIMNDKVDLNRASDLIYLLGDDWREAIIDLSLKPEKVKKYLNIRKL